MAIVTTDNKHYSDIADAIRTKGVSGSFTPSQMASAIEQIEGGSGAGGDYNIESVDDGNGGQILNITDAAGGSIDRVSWHQCPEAVRSYLDNVTYAADDYSNSEITRYAPGSAVRSNTKPIGKAVDGVVFYNEIPNAKTPFATQNKAGTIKPLDRLRWINSATDNMRDLGGWACDGGTIKYGKLFRGGECAASDKELALGLGIRHELNLRGNEIPMRTASVWGVEYSQFSTYAWNVNDLPVWTEILHTIFNCVNHNIPLFFHCAAGADRTGAAALVVEAILGVSQSDCDKDYELTCFYSGTGTDANARRRNEADWKNSIDYINALEGETFRDKAINFALSHGITYDDINLFRSNMIDGNPQPIVPPTPLPIQNLVESIGYAADTRVGTSDGTNRAGVVGIASFGAENNINHMIPIAAGDVIRIKGVTFPSASDGKCAIVIYQADGSFYFATYMYIGYTHFSGHADVVYNDDLTTITIPLDHNPKDAYMRICGLCTSPTDVIITRNEEIPQEETHEYTNQIPLSLNADGSVCGLLTDVRYNSGDSLVVNEKTDACGYIPVEPGDVVRFKKMEFGHNGAGSYYIRAYTALGGTTITGGQVSPYQLQTNNYPSTFNFMDNIIYDANNNVTQFTIRAGSQFSAIKYIRLAWGRKGDAVITVNEVIE